MLVSSARMTFLAEYGSIVITQLLSSFEPGSTFVETSRTC